MALIDQAAGPDTSVSRTDWPTPELADGSRSNLDPMAPWKRILVPVDFSLESMKTLSYASKLAQSLSACLDIVHVLTTRPRGARVGAVPLLAGLDREDLAEAARAKLLAVIKRKVHWQVPWNVWIRDGQPHREILEAAARYDVDALVLHTRSKPSLEGFVDQGVTRRLVFGASCPVLAIPPQVLWQSGESLPLVSPDHWHTILIPTEMSRVGENALARGLALARWFNARVTAFNVLRTGRLYSHYRPTGARNRRFVQTKSRFRTWVHRHAPPDVHLDMCVGVGSPASTFLRAARHMRAHLIVMGTQQFSGWRRLRALRTISRILADTPCPILCVPQPPGGLQMPAAAVSPTRDQVP